MAVVVTEDEVEAEVAVKQVVVEVEAAAEEEEEVVEVVSTDMAANNPLNLPSGKSNKHFC